MRASHDYDVVIAGGGLTGASLALALSGAGRIALIEAVPPDADRHPGFDSRGLGLALSSRRILEGLGVWEDIATSAVPLARIHVSDQSQGGMVRLCAVELQLPALGYVVQARPLGQALARKIHSASFVEFICPATVTDARVLPEAAEITLKRDGREKKIRGRLLVIADGAASRLRDLFGFAVTTLDYRQTAIVTTVSPGLAHEQTAYERFTPYGPVALLPLPANRMSVVFTVRSVDAQQYLTMGDEEFLSALRSHFGARLGLFTNPGPRQSYPLRRVLAPEQTRERVVLLGNTAHTLHPNGAQGFNLCLRDVASLAELLMPELNAQGDPGRLPILRRYLEGRAADQGRVACFSHGLASLFYNDLPHKTLARNLAMLFLNLCPPARRALVRLGTGLYGRQPLLVRGVG